MASDKELNLKVLAGSLVDRLAADSGCICSGSEHPENRRHREPVDGWDADSQAPGIRPPDNVASKKTSECRGRSRVPLPPLRDAAMHRIKQLPA